MKNELIGEGATAEIFDWGKDRVLKLYRKGWDIGEAEFETAVCQFAHQSGLPVPGVLETIEVEGRNGIVFERIDGPTLGEQIRRQGLMGLLFIRKTARILAKCHSAIHTRIVPKEAADVSELTKQHYRFEHYINSATQLSEKRREKALTLLDKLPKGTSLCHGDFHSENIICSKNDHFVIDWGSAHSGNPWGDVAFSSINIKISAPPPDSPKIERFLVKFFLIWLNREYLKQYLKLKPDPDRQLEAWYLPAMVARLGQLQLSGSQSHLAGLIRNLLCILNDEMPD